MWSSSYVSMTQLSITLVGSCYVQPIQKIFSSCMNHLEEWVNKTMKTPSRKKWWLDIPNQVKLFEIRTWFNPKKQTETFGCYASISMVHPVLSQTSLPKMASQNGTWASAACPYFWPLETWGPNLGGWWTYHGAEKNRPAIIKCWWLGDGADDKKGWHWVNPTLKMITMIYYDNSSWVKNERGNWQW